jgi:hypothetical protein
MSKTYRIELSDLDLHQVVDGLVARAEAWEKTAIYFRTGKLPSGERFIIEECGDEFEAKQIAKSYRAIIEIIREQMERQRV